MSLAQNLVMSGFEKGDFPGKLDNFCRTHEQIKLVKEKPAKENLFLCAGLKLVSHQGI